MPLPEDWQWIEELIAEEGRSMTITLPGSEANAAKPWRGNAAGTPTNSIGLMVRYKASQIDNDHIKRGDQKIYIVPSDTVNIEQGTKVVDSLDTSSWNVIDVEKITSKSDIILYVLQVRQ